MLIRTATNVFYQDATDYSTDPLLLYADPTAVWDIVFTPNSASFFTADSTNTITQWDAATLTPMAAWTLEDPFNDDIGGLDISSDGHFLVAELMRRTGHWYSIIDLRRGELLPPPGDTTIHYSVEGDRVRVIGLQGGATRLWEATDGTWQMVIDDLPAQPPGTSFTMWLSDDGRFVYFHNTTLDETTVFNTDTREVAGPFTMSTSANDTTRSGDDVIAYINEEDVGAVQLWTPDATNRYPRPDAPINTFMRMKAGDRLISYEADNFLTVLIDRRDANNIENVTRNERLQAFAPNGDGYAVITMDPATGTQTLVIGTEFGVLPIENVDVPPGAIEQLNISPDGQRLYARLARNSAAPEETYLVYDVASGAIIEQLTVPNGPGLNRITFNPATNQPWRVSGGLLEALSGENAPAAVRLPGLQARVVDFAYTSDGTGMLVAGTDLRVRLYDLSTQVEIWRSDRIARIRSIHAGENVVAVLTADNGLAVFNATDGAVVYVEPVPDVEAIALHPTAGVLAARGAGVTSHPVSGEGTAETLVMWDESSGVSQPSVIAVGPQGHIAIAGFDPAGAPEGVVGMGATQVIIYPDVDALRSNAEPLRFTVPGQFITDMAFSEDGTRLVVANGVARTYDVGNGAMLWVTDGQFTVSGVAVAAGVVYGTSPHFSVASSASVYELATGETLGLITLDIPSRGGGGSGGFVTHEPIAVSPDGRRLAHSGDALIVDWERAAVTASLR